MRMLQIKSKKDWFIAFFIAFLFIYLIAMRFRLEINEFLLPLTPDKISYFNQPENQGVYAVTILTMALLSIGVMIYKKVRGKFIALTLLAGVVTAAAMMGSYYYQCHLILNIPAECKPNTVSIHYFDERNLSAIHDSLDEATEEQLVSKVLALQPLVSEKGEKPKDRNGTDGSSVGEMDVSIWYPHKNGTSYHIWVSVDDSEIRIHRGNSPESDPIYQDNGLLEILERIRNNQPNLIPGVYKFQESDEPVKPNVELKAHNQFVFTYSSLSSYLAIGTYMINNNNLILETNDGKYSYIFKIMDNTLVFNKKESSSIPLGNLEDGSVFVIQEE